MGVYKTMDETIISTGTHKVLFLNESTLDVIYEDYITAPYTLGLDWLTSATSNMRGINTPYIVVDASYTGTAVSQAQLTSFQRLIAFEEIERNYLTATANLMGISANYDEYLANETALKKRYFEVKQQIPLSTAPLTLNLKLLPNA